MEITEEEMLAANQRAERSRAALPRIASVQCTLAALAITFETGVQLRVPTRLIQGLAGAPASALREIVVSPLGNGLHFPAVDADIYLPGLFKGIFGSRVWMQGLAAEMGSKGGRAVTADKRRAAQRNGALGGRPKKQAGA